MRKICIILLLLITVSVFAQDKLVVFKKNGIIAETLTSSIDSITYPNETIMRIHIWNGTKTDFMLDEIDSIKMIPDQGTTQTDREALIVFYNSTGGPNWANNTNWCTNKPLSEWYGVSTDANGRVSGLYSSYNQLTGILPPELGSLTKLISLNITGSQLTGSIPPELGRLANLKDLQLQSNQLTGSIPSEIGQMDNLTDLYLNNNQLSGSIPAEIGHLTHLWFLNLGFNQLTGNIPPELGQLANLGYLTLMINNLSGSIPPELAKLSNLLELILSENKLTGAIPRELGQMTNLRNLNLMLNELSGLIPSDLGKMSSLMHLTLGRNQFSGPIPIELSQLSNLIYLDLSGIKFEGTIPPELGKLSNLQKLILNDNRFSGAIPSELGKLTNLTDLNLHFNDLTGSIPPELGNLTKLQWLSLSSNFLTGSIPPELGQISSLEYLNLSCNQLSGDIPIELGQLQNIKNLDLSSNQYIGEIPREVAILFSLPNLSELNIKYNRFNGTLPTSLINHTHWNELVWGIVKQEPGYAFEREIVSTVSAHVTDIDNETIDLDSLFALNKLTVVFKWSDWDPYTGQFLPILKNVFQTYSSKGLGVISYIRSINGDINAIKTYIRDNQMVWTNVVNMDDKNTLANFPDMTVPNVHVVDQAGEVVFSDQLWDKREDFEKFITSRLGPMEFYQSTDYSQDGLVTKLQNATIGNGVNIVLMGDGFVDTTLVAGGLYEQKMHEAMEHFFSIEPTKSYREYFNVYAVKAISKHGVFMDRTETAFSSKFGINRGVSGDLTRIKEYAMKIGGPNSSETHIITILNSTGRAGSCYQYDDGSISLLSAPYDIESFSGVIQHEAVGHGLGKLGDEYIDHYETITQAEQDRLIGLQSKGWYLNLSLSATNPPWAHFIGNSNYPKVGVFEGGFYYWKGVWRPEENSSMIVSKLHYFNAPSREQIVKRTFQAAGVTYSWDDFVANDKEDSGLKSAKTFKVNREQETEPLSPPVIMNNKLFE